MDIRPIIVTGGSGTRLRPLSRKAFPEPFLSLNRGLTLLQDTVGPLCGNDRMRAPLVVCNPEHRSLVAEQCGEVQCHPELILLEPIGRNTAPALTAAALAARAEGATIRCCSAMPSDHVFRGPEALPAAADGRLMTFGIVRDRAETGYGYIHAGAALGGGRTQRQQHRRVRRPWVVGSWVMGSDQARSRITRARCMRDSYHVQRHQHAGYARRPRSVRPFVADGTA